MYLQWNDQLYATGVAIIDEQHKALFTKINALLTAMQQGKGNEEIGQIVAFLEKYVVKHFSCEEQLMERSKCSSCAANKVAHQKFLGEFGAIKKKFVAEGATMALKIEIQTKLCDWLTTHISACDTKLRETTQKSAA